ncbi:bleomycin resistance protein [Histidinibacterium aquaticum]|uniref:Bleomycin resistance protein n=1 Tax=Histidinibacterium aquaticum TaxID=2613962 RepID=A0A5J5GQY0_9RHOB|nr:VOC family protein [Histidinibacterium aquaticum]KAA9010600.1 VOC family protein [Histidinibacterium aquaticum]
MTPLLPELYCRDLATSLSVYLGPLGFETLYERTGFARLSHHGAELMLEEITPDSWFAAPAAPPFGRGVHFQIATPDAAALHRDCRAADLPVFRQIEDAWYRAGDRYLGQRQFVVADPDGYLLRFAEPLGEARHHPAEGRTVT